MKILVLNGGSSSLKATLFGEDAHTPLWDAQADWGRSPGKALIRVRAAGAPAWESNRAIASSREVLGPVIEMLWSGPAKAIDGPAEVAAVGHRVVHGGKAFTTTTRITDEVRAGIARYCDFAPEHNRLELEAIETATRLFGPDTPQIAVFDTAFHSTMPEAAKIYPVPFEWSGDEGIHRYGFHGISHQYTSRRAAEILRRDPAGLRLVTCHLGNGASLAAISGGRSVDTTMGFTPLEGLMMGTRSGTIDPGLVIYLVRHRGYTADQLDHVLNKESGLKGVSGISGDMRAILDAVAAGNARAQLAFDVYVHRLCREIGGMVAVLGGLDALVFTAGIGENCPPLRRQVCERLGFLGIQLDTDANAHPAMDTDIATADSRVRVLVVRTDEDGEIARECRAELASE